jgi:iron complex outermembrane recepter protein
MKAYLLAATAATITLATSVQAQEAAPTDVAAVDTEDAAPAEIVVTAQKRAERLQDVPVALSVISGDAIANQGGVNIENAQYLVPSLNFRKSGTTLNQFLFLRGIGTANFSIAAEPSVSAVLDGVVLSTAGEAFADLVDVERVEVLRGPQGTLFGKNASAGVINIVSKRPTDALEGFGEAGYFFGEGTEYRLRGGVNVPFSPTVAGRFTGFYGDYEGNVRNVAPNVASRVNGYEHYGFRGVIEAEASDSLDITLIGDWRKSDDDCCAEIIGGPPLTAAGAVNTANLALIQTVLPTLRGDKTKRIAQNLVTATEEESYGLSLQADLDVGAAGTITSITAHRWFDNVEIRDGDFLPRAYVGFAQLHDVGPQESKTFSQELRLTSPGGQALEYVLGGYFSRNKNVRTFTRNDIVCTAAAGVTLPAGVLTPCGTAGLTAPSTFPSGTATFGSTFENLAAFGQLTYNVTDALRLIGGLRYTQDDLDVFHRRVTTLAGPGINPNFDQGVQDRFVQLLATTPGLNPNTAATQAVAASNGQPWRDSSSKNNLSGRAGIQYDLSDDNMVYATYARGYKGPAFNVFFNMNPLSTNRINAETADSYEIGLKNTLLDGALVLNLAGFYAKYKNFQANNPDVVAGVVTTRLTNAGTVSTRGVEADLIARPTDNWSLTGGFAYTDAKIDRFRAPVGAPANQIIPNGTQLTSAPKFKASLTSDTDIETGGFANIFFGGSLAYQSKQLTQLSPDPIVRATTTVDAYALVDLQAGLEDPDERWKLSFLVRNAFDQDFAAAIQTGGPAGSYRFQRPREANRYYGLSLRVNFGGQ